MSGNEKVTCHKSQIFGKVEKLFIIFREKNRVTLSQAAVSKTDIFKFYYRGCFIF
jgi:hypothetical protein